jgi:alpha-mannosidase
LAPSETRASAVRSTPVALSYDVATASNDGEHSTIGFDGKGNALSAEMLPSQLQFNGAHFQLASAKSNIPNAVTAKGQTIHLPAGQYNRIYVLAASANGDQKAIFYIGGKKAEVNIQDWSGFIGQWDDRQWTSADPAHDHYGEMTGLQPGFIKRADLAWYCSHHHDAAGKNVDYSYSYLFAYPFDLPHGAKTIQLPKNENIRILAISLADENPGVKPARPLYDVLPNIASVSGSH